MNGAGDGDFLPRHFLLPAFYKPASDVVPGQAGASLEEQVALLPVDHHGIAVTLAPGPHSRSLPDIGYPVDFIFCAVLPHDDAREHRAVLAEFHIKQIVDGLKEANVVRTLAKTITTQAERKIPVAVGHSVAQWTEENAAYTESNPTFGQKQIDAYKLTDLIRVSTELLQDSAFALEPYIREEFVRAFGVAEEEAFCVGNGTKQPTGIFTANGGEVGVTAAGATAITVDELISLIYSLKSPYRRNAKFFMHDSTVALIRKLKDNNGAYLWQPSVQAGEPDRLLGYPLYTSPYVPQVKAGALAVAFGDFKNYWIADRAGRTVQRLNELYAGNGQVGFIATERVDGKVILPEGIKLLKMKAS